MGSNTLSPLSFTVCWSSQVALVCLEPQVVQSPIVTMAGQHTHTINNQNINCGGTLSEFKQCGGKKTQIVRLACVFFSPKCGVEEFTKFNL